MLRVRKVKTRHVDSEIFDKDVIYNDGLARLDDWYHINDKPLALNGRYCGEVSQITKEEFKKEYPDYDEEQ